MRFQCREAIRCDLERTDQIKIDVVDLVQGFQMVINETERDEKNGSHLAFTEAL